MRTHSRSSIPRSAALPGTALLLAVLLAGCADGLDVPSDLDGPSDPGTSENGTDGTDGTDGSDDVDDSEGSDDTDGPDDTDDETDEEETVEYVWGLPPSDTSVGSDIGHGADEGKAYLALQSSCAEGAEFLAPERSPDYGFESPRNVLLFAAGVQLCEGDPGEAAELFERARTMYGFAGLAPERWAFCDLYKVIRSVLEQRPTTDYQCEGGTWPPFTTTESGTDDVLTPDIDESLGESPVDPDGGTGTDPDGGTGTDPDGETGTGADGDGDGLTDTDAGIDTDAGGGAETETQPDAGTDPAP